MNGSGIIGKQENLPAFFHRLKEVLARDGQLLLDSSDLSYLFEDEDGNLDIAPEDDYFGEIDFRMQYKSIKGIHLMVIHRFQHAQSIRKASRLQSREDRGRRTL